jgi:hypothetical protein
VTSVPNQVVIRQRVNTAALTGNITHMLHRSWFFAPTTIHAWPASGATSMENDIIVVRLNNRAAGWARSRLTVIM